MKKLSLLTLILLTSSTYYVPLKVEVVEIPTKEVTFEVESEVELELAPVELRNLDKLVEALIWVESRGNDSAFHKGENAVGCLQIRPIMVKEVNRVLG